MRKRRDFSLFWYLSQMLCSGVPSAGAGNSPISICHESTFPRCLSRFLFHPTQSLGPFNFLIFDVFDRELASKMTVSYSVTIGYVEVGSGGG